MNPVAYQIISAVLAGGLAGQLTTLLLRKRYESRRDEENWLRQERYKLFSHLLELTASIVTHEEDDNLGILPDQIRATSVKIHLLYPGGEAPEEVGNILESLFQLSLKRKLKEVATPSITPEEAKDLRHAFRDETRKLRRRLSESLILYSKL